MKFLYLFLISLFVTSCNLPQPADPLEEQRLVNEIERHVFSKLKKEKDLIPFGTGGQTADGIKMLCLAFQYRTPVDIDSGRKLLIDGVKELASAVNAERDIHRYLVDYPFDAKNIIIAIYLQNPDGSEFGPDKLSLIKAEQGILNYKIFNPETNKLITVFTETYEEALQRCSQ